VATGGGDEARLSEHLGDRFARELELHPNRIEFHTEEEMRKLQGVGTQLKEQRVVDHRPRANGKAQGGAEARSVSEAAAQKP
jgi:hypothetical protein